MNITKDISPLTEFKRDSARLIAQIKETGRPQILTVNGKPSVVVMDAAAWLCCTNRLSVRVPLSPDGLIPWLQ